MPSRHWMRGAALLLAIVGGGACQPHDPDSDLERGRAALRRLRPRTIVPKQSVDRVSVDLMVALEPGESAGDWIPLIEARLAMLRLRATVEDRGNAVGVILLEAPLEQLPRIAATLAAQGRIRIANLQQSRPALDMSASDPAIDWQPLTVVGVTPVLDVADVTLHLSPDGGATLAELTARGGYLAVAFDDLVLLVARIDETVDIGRLTISDHADEVGDPRGSAGVIAIALALQSATTRSVEVEGDTREAIPCTGSAVCKTECADGSGVACLRVADDQTGWAGEREALTSACAAGGNEGCLRLCSGGPTKSCLVALDQLSDFRSAWYDPRLASAIRYQLCRSGEFDSCRPAMASLIFGPLGTGDYVTAEDMLRQIDRWELLGAAATLHQEMVDVADEACHDDWAEFELAAESCLFLVHVSPDRSGGDELLRRAGASLRQAYEGP